ncbi:MAG TPA: alpha/beta hydrolase [Burkholderiales bacterium]|jgi:arylformamidase|nr:alpha/beta hydrolase [Burkholderiales bacterium]
MTETSSTIIYRGMDRAALDAAYNNSAAVIDSPQWLDEWRKRSAVMRERKDATLGIAYGERERERIDYFPSGKAAAPLFVFIHGGYWVRNSIDMFSFLAEGPNARGIDLAVIGYTLAPEARLSGIVEEIRAGLSYLKNQADLGFDSERIYTGGWSAGGHLAAITSDHPAVRGALPISGIFDLEPVSLSYLNEALQLTAADIETLSPINHLKSGLPPHRLVVGGNELSELQRQSRNYNEAALNAGVSTSLQVLPGHHHFSILDELAKPDGTVTEELLQLVAL